MELKLDKCGILWYNISIMGSIHPFVAAPLRLLLLLRPYKVPGVGPGPCQIHIVDFSIWQKINLLLLDRREHKLDLFLAAVSCCLWGLPQDQAEPPPPRRAGEVTSDIGSRRKMRRGLDKMGVAW